MQAPQLSTAEQLARIRSIKARNAKVAHDFNAAAERKRDEKARETSEIKAQKPHTTASESDRTHSLERLLELTTEKSRRFKDGRRNKTLERTLKAHKKRLDKLNKLLSVENIQTYASKFNKPCCSEYQKFPQYRKRKCIELDTTDTITDARKLFHHSIEGDAVRIGIAVKNKKSLGHKFFVKGQPVCGKFAAHCYGVSDYSILTGTRRRISTLSLRRLTATENQAGVLCWLMGEADLNEK